MYPQINPVMIHNSIPGAAVVSHNQVYQLYHGLRASGVSKPLFRLEKAPQHVHGSIPQNILGLKWTPTATTKSEKNSFLLYVCFVIFVFEFFKTGTPFFPSYIRKKVFVMLLVVLCFHCVVILEKTVRWISWFHWNKTNMTDVLCGKGALSSGGMTTTGPQGQHHSAEKHHTEKIIS